MKRFFSTLAVLALPVALGAAVYFGTPVVSPSSSPAAPGFPRRFVTDASADADEAVDPCASDVELERSPSPQKPQAATPL